MNNLKKEYSFLKGYFPYEKNNSGVWEETPLHRAVKGFINKNLAGIEGERNSQYNSHFEQWEESFPSTEFVVDGEETPIVIFDWVWDEEKGIFDEYVKFNVEELVKFLKNKLFDFQSNNLFFDRKWNSFLKEFSK